MGLWGGHLAGEGQVPRWALRGVDGGRREGGHFRVEEAGTRRGKGAGATEPGNRAVQGVRGGALECMEGRGRALEALKALISAIGGRPGTPPPTVAIG